MPYSDQDQALDGKPPEYAELFRFQGAQDEVPENKSAWEQPATENKADTLPDAQDGTLPFVRLAGSSAIIAAALGIASEDLPRRHYSSADAFRFAVHIEKNVGIYRPNLPKDPSARKAITREVEKVMSGTVAPRRRDTLLRWFRDPAAPPTLNPWKLIDPKEKAEGNLLQLLHPIVFNAILLIVSIVTVAVVFAYGFRGDK